MIRTTKANLFKEFKRDHPDSPIKIGIFRKVTKHIKRAKRRTDVCVSCDRLNYIQKVKHKKQQNRKHIPEELIHEEEMLILHHQHASKQRKAIEEQVQTSVGDEVQFIELIRELQVAKILSHNHTFINFQPEVLQSCTALKFDGQLFLLAFKRTSSTIHAIGLPSTNPDDWDCIAFKEDVKLRIKQER
ncbi:hypothetical protein BLNAU_15709 [Blattamonas nauphoetae]|uniref:Uncharacterized protein n=1 Tax=Blattamonas nauphoetae TaxID=2049346 RepID=A0ABQ9XER1_9EUKA|nr:hypothetical protein BLNAU_15709 [Blattamonas nauphoetae]